MSNDRCIDYGKWMRLKWGVQDCLSRMLGWIVAPGIFKSPSFVFLGYAVTWSNTQEFLKGACVVMTTGIIAIQLYNAVRSLRQKNSQDQPPK